MGDWLNHWGLVGNPFDTRFLSYRDPNFYDLLVSNRNIVKIDEYFPSIITQGRAGSMLILGERASGKTTLLHYILYKIKKMNEKGDPRSENLFPMIMSFKSPDAYKSVKNLSDNFYEAVLRSMKHSLNNHPYRSRYVDTIGDLENAIKSIDLKDQQIIDVVENTSRIIGRDFNKGILMIDNLDKASDKHPEIIEDFLTQSQGFIENTLWDNGIQTIIVGPPFWIGLRIEANSEFSWLYDTHLYMKKWRYNDIEELIANRLKKYSSYSEFSINRYFSPEALNEIYLQNGGNPRYCIRAASSCLFHAWKKNLNSISEKFLTEHPHCALGTVEEIELKVHYDLDRRINNDPILRIAYERLSKIIKDNKKASLSLVEDIFKLYNERNVEMRSLDNYEILLSNRFALPEGNPSIPTSRKSFYLDTNIRKLIIALFEEFDGNEKRARNFIVRQFGM